MPQLMIPGTRYIVGQFEVFQSDEAAVIDKPIGHFIGSLVEIGIFCGRILEGPVIVVHLAQRIPVISIIISLCSQCMFSTDMLKMDMMRTVILYIRIWMTILPSQHDQ